jgi:hypothetical protein
MRLALALVLAAAFATPAFAKLPVKPIKIAIKHKEYEIDVAYPRTGNKAVDAAMADWAKGEVDQFKNDSAGNDGDGSSSPYSLDINFDIARSDDKVFAVVFTESTYEGGAHPNTFFRTMNFLMPDGWQVYLPEIFTPDALKTISRLATADLKKQLKPDEGFDADMVKTGAGPNWNNFADFTILPDALDIQYSPYAVAPYVAGPQETKLPLAPLRSFLRPDWRAPQASFDCTKASAWVEKTICSDVKLARLDRSVADAYATRLGETDSDAARLPVRGDQREFLAARIKKCGAQAGKAAVTCLTAQYNARLKVLNAPPQ